MVYEIFKSSIIDTPMHNVFSNIKKFYKQERDWTCSFACIKSITDIDVLEDELIKEYDLTPSPYFSTDIKQLGIIESLCHKTSDVIYGCDNRLVEKEDKLALLNELMLKGYNIMVEMMLSGSHWFVFVGYIALGNPYDTSTHQVLLYDPYQNSTRMVIAEDFVTMWEDSKKHDIVADFIAVKNF